MTITLAIDCMGGDHGPSVTVPASLAFLKSEPSVNLILVGREAPIQSELNRLSAASNPRITDVNASEVVEMDDP